MAKQIRTTLKSFFQTGDVPTENNYADLVDSNLNLSENNTGDIQLTGEITASGNISSSGNINANQISGSHISASGNINAIQISGSHISASGNISAIQISGSHISASGNISTGGTLEGNSLDILNTTFNGNTFTTSGDIVFDSSADIQLDAAGGNIEFKDAGTLQLTLDMDGTAGAQVITPGVAGDDIIFKNQGGDSVLTLKSEGQTEIHGNVTASGNISASGNLIASTLNTGQGDNELFDMDQNVTTTSAVTFTTVNTGQGNNELYDMNQNVKTTSGVTFSTLSIPIIDFSQVPVNGFTADFSGGQVDIGSAYGGSIVITNVPSTAARSPIINFKVTAARCQAIMIVVANSDSTVLVSPNTIQSGVFFLDLSCGHKLFAGGTIRINFQMLGA